MTEVYQISENIYRVRAYKNKPLRETLLAKYRLLSLKPDGEPILLSKTEEDHAKSLRDSNPTKRYVHVYPGKGS